MSNIMDLNDNDIEKSLLRGYIVYKGLDYITNYKLTVKYYNNWDSYWHYPYNYYDNLDINKYYITTSGSFSLSIDPFTIADYYNNQLTKIPNIIMFGYILHEDFESLHRVPPDQMLFA